jgi:hypothetical protein
MKVFHFHFTRSARPYDMITNVRTIQEMGQKIKDYALPRGEDMVAEWGLVAIVFLLAVASFGLGRLSALEDAKPPVAIGDSIAATKPAVLFMGGLVVASRSGSAYYFPWCAGAQKIVPANQVWFQSEQAAQQAGYSPAKACKGLGN